LADGFFSDRNFFTYQWEKFVTYLSLESDLSRMTKSDAHGAHVMLVACGEEDGQVVALCDVDNRSSLPRHQRPYMSNLAVCPSWRNQGIAKALVAACEAIVGAEWKEASLHLKARQTNEAAIRMYKSLGYEIQSETFDFTYMDQLVIMKKTIAVAPDDVKEEISSNNAEGTKVVGETLVSSSASS
jgi:ribosomal protein S18 acetylase RimI-like enzyme